MTSVVAPPTVFADLLILAALFAAVTRSAVAAPIRAFLAGLSCLAAWAIAMVLEALRSPAWLLAITGAVILLSLAAVIATVHQATRPDQGDDPSDGRSEPDSPGPSSPSRNGDGDEPSWWPEFERQFAAHVRQTERRESRQPAAPST